MCGFSLLPVVLLWSRLVAWTAASPTGVRAIVFSFSIVPSYILFAMCLMVLSALSTRTTGWRTIPNLQMPIRELDWPLLNWARYLVASHVVPKHARLKPGRFMLVSL